MRYHRLIVDHETTPCGQSRVSVGNYCYYVMNRSDARAEVFYAEGDYRAYLNL